MDKRTELKEALKTALKEKNQIAMSTIRLITAAIKDRDIEARSKGNNDGISDQEILSLLQSMIKQRQESSKTYADAGRPELAEREDKEIEVIKSFLPKQLDESEVVGAIDSLVTEVGANDIRDMGKVMAELKARYAGQIDMGKASNLVKQRLAS
ncbi:MAG: GatB/YqeY domain-containing protein [Alphaproteobacteria bacterium]|nr:GatB/YqeY domain-containing protein [Alphaproteobacteria bacterium]MDP7222017.1 GatB/YqeY domain-containing protein [Alphaproteobacteria bacterium]